jgi:hypothetical protein
MVIPYDHIKSYLSNLKPFLAPRQIHMCNRALPTDNRILHFNKAHMSIIHICILDLLKGNRRHKAFGSPGLIDLGIKLVNLLERETLGFIDHGPHEKDAKEAAAAPDEEDFGFETGVTRASVDQIGGSIGDGLDDLLVLDKKI